MSNVKNVLIALTLAIVVCSCTVFLPCIQKVSDNPAWLGSALSLQEVGLALVSYHQAFGKLPPAVVYDNDGKALYSWRVLVLPFLDLDHIHERFKLDEPWDSEHNKSFLDTSRHPWRSRYGGFDPVGTTRYQVLVGPGTAFERPGLTFNDFPDGLENTILVVEASEPVPWSKPADLVYDPKGPLPGMKCEFSMPVKFLCHQLGRKSGFNAIFADGHRRFIFSSTDDKIIRAMITRDGGEGLTPADLR